MNNGCSFAFCGHSAVALAERALWLPTAGVLTVSDLHLGKSDRIARRSGRLLPPYETVETLSRLEHLVDTLKPARVICLGDSFDDLDAATSLPEAQRLTLLRMQAGRDWIWIEGNHDPGPVDLGGRHLLEHMEGKIVFRHIAQPQAEAEVSGHYHPKCRLSRGSSVPSFLVDASRIILPAFGAYTGGLKASHPVFRSLMKPDAVAVLTGRKALSVPFQAVA